MRYLSSDTLTWLLFAAASALLAIQPLHWLVQSWISPAYGSYGYVYVLAIAGLVLRSILSGKPQTPETMVPVLGLLLAAAGLRLLGQVLAINILSALSLAVDVFALVRLLGLAQRPFALSPLWVAVLFLFSLPVEMVLQRLIGFPLQMISAELSCAMLGLVYDDLTCAGVRIAVQGHDVLVDLPCSGASGLLLTMAVFVAMNAVYRPQLLTACVCGIGVLLLATLGNGLRITLLAAGLAQGWDVMAEPWHSLIGLLTLALTLFPLMLWYRPRCAAHRPTKQNRMVLPRRAGLLAGFAGLFAAVAIVSAPASPVDISAPMNPRDMPQQLDGYRVQPVALTPMERAYFAAYGGDAQKAQFGPLGLNVVSTRSPLRHLHAPEICLRGLGYHVRFLGTRYDGVPSAHYEATGPDGDRWQVAVSYVADTGDITPSIGEAIWRWMNGQGGVWSSVQRITPITLDKTSRARLEAAALAALDITPTEGDGA